MTKVIFNVEVEVSMDGFSEPDIINMGTMLARGGVNDIASVCQGAEVKSIQALPVIEAIDCMIVPEEEIVQ